MTAETIDTIAAAIADRYSAANMPPPGGAPTLLPVRMSSADLPNRLTKLPAVLVFVDSGILGAGGPPTQARLSVLTYFVRFYLDKRKDLPRETNAIRRWLPTLVGQLQGSVQLGGLSGVARCWTDSYRVGTMQYQRADYAGAEIVVKVKTSIAWAAVA